MTDPILIRKVKDPYGWLGNMSPHPVDGFRTAEAAFQASRFPKNSPVVEKIRAERSPMGAKMVAKRHAPQMFIAPRSPVDVEMMEWVLRQKLVEHPELVLLLKETGTAAIIEDCSARPSQSGLFWGAKCIGDHLWVGDNQLGRLWTLIRATL